MEELNKKLEKIIMLLQEINDKLDNQTNLVPGQIRVRPIKLREVRVNRLRW